MNKKIAIMQPYFFPYLGYFQLLTDVDEFVFYDNVNYIKQGWINRNRLIVNHNTSYFTVPITGQKSSVSIIDTLIDRLRYERWRTKLYKTITQNYSSNLHFNLVFEKISSVLDSNHLSIASLSIASIKCINELLNINTIITTSSEDYREFNCSGAAKLLEICRSTKADCYVNLPGGEKIYSVEAFKREGVALRFISPQTSFLKRDEMLSILHLLFKYGPVQVTEWLGRYDYKL